MAWGRELGWPFETGHETSIDNAVSSYRLLVVLDDPSGAAHCPAGKFFGGRGASRLGPSKPSSRVKMTFTFASPRLASPRPAVKGDCECERQCRFLPISSDPGGDVPERAGEGRPPVCRPRASKGDPETGARERAFIRNQSCRTNSRASTLPPRPAEQAASSASQRRTAGGSTCVAAPSAATSDAATIHRANTRPPIIALPVTRSSSASNREKRGSTTTARRVFWTVRVSRLLTRIRQANRCPGPPAASRTIGNRN